MDADLLTNLRTYLQNIKIEFHSGHAKEHAYRPALKILMDSLEDCLAVNDPLRSEHGNPDYIFLKRSNQKIIRGYAEAKDITVDLDKTERTNQMERYGGYANLFLTNYLEFRFFRNGEKYQTLSLGHIKNGLLYLNNDPTVFSRLADELVAFIAQPPEKIRSGRRLAEIMGGKARRIRDNVITYLADSGEKNHELERMYDMMKTMLVQDLSTEKFADMYAQTLVYGLFVARYDDDSPENFSRQEARDLVPASNPFLRQFFDHIVGPNFDTRLGYIVDELCQVFSVSPVQDIVHKHLRISDQTTDIKDPIIHFYEDFLSEYDPLERKRMGAYYTPIPIVRFIIRQIDKILKEEFGIAKGIASDELIELEREVGQNLQTDRRKKAVTSQKISVPRVQILDPAVGTATFLNETIKYIYEGFKGQEGRWPAYAKDSLMKRLHGFELMMAPYTIAHLKLGMTLKETGVDKLTDRLGVYLTNTLEEGIPQQPDLFSFGLAQAVSEESRLAAEIKSERPIMIVIGNPPYSGVSSNETTYANSLISKYKVEPGGQQRLQERKHWLNDDYVKFIAFAEDMIENNGGGIVAMITNNGYLDNPTFRGMRWHLAKTFDKIYILDLHGNAKKREVAIDGSKDENVFEIMQGVGIIVAVKNEKKSSLLATVYHAELYGTRKNKFQDLFGEPTWKQISLDEKSVYFVPKSLVGQQEYQLGIRLDQLFLQNATGIVTMGDKFIIDEDKDVVASRVQKLARGEYDEATLNHSFGLGKNYAKFILSNHTKLRFDESKLVKLNYRLFDKRWTYYDNKVLWRWRDSTMKHYIGHNNIGILFSRMTKGRVFAHISITSLSSEVIFLSPLTGTNAFNAPLYLYHSDGTRTVNFNPAELSVLTRNLTNDFTPEDILDYIYAILHSPTYREKYKEFLKIDFPRVPPAANDTKFSRLVTIGRQLRELHLMKSPILNDYITTFPAAGSDTVEKVSYDGQNVWINAAQYFGGVPETAWNFYIGGYQPAQKWLKDRRGRILSSVDLDHYQKIIKILVQTDRTMKEIDQ